MAEWLASGAAVSGAIVAVIAAWVGLRTFLHQRTSNDVALALSLFAEINRYWDRISLAQGEAEYNYGQILAYFEIACALFNKNILSSDANSILGDHIVEVFAVLQASENGRAIIKTCKSSSSTFSELEKFGKSRFSQALQTLAFEESKD
jgi:hypothetical protein